MQLFGHIKEMWGLSLTKLAERLKISHRTVVNYDNFSRELPLWRLIQLVYETGMAWEKVGELLEQDYTRRKVNALAKEDATGRFQNIMKDGKNETKKDNDSD